MNINGDANRCNFKTEGPIIPDRSLKAKVILRSSNEYNVSRIAKSENKSSPENDIHQVNTYSKYINIIRYIILVDP